MNSITNYMQKHDLKVYESAWLMYVHVLAVIGAIWFLTLESGLFYKYLITFAIWHFLTALGITGGAHRLWAHKAYNASLLVKIYLMLANSNCFQGSIWHWSRDHRLHHKFTDTPLDPHDSKKGFWFSHIGWLLKNKSKELIAEGKKIDMSDLKADPVVMFQKKHYYKLSFTMAFVIPALTGFLISDKLVFNFLFLGFTKYVFMLHVTWCVNSVCHMWGTRQTNPNIEPRDNIFVSFFAAGEGWHNWHHEYPKDWRASKNEWWMINFTQTFIQMCELFGLADTNLKQPLKRHEY